jgi:hypothetical protein
MAAQAAGAVCQRRCSQAGRIRRSSLAVGVVSLSGSVSGRSFRDLMRGKTGSGSDRTLSDGAFFKDNRCDRSFEGYHQPLES